MQSPADTSRPMRQFPLAPHPEIMRADQKDSDYVNYLCQACHDAYRSFFGTVQATAHQNETKLAGQVLYYTLTTGLGVQTLGEEYSNIIQVSGEPGISLTPARRVLLIVLQTALPYFADRVRREISRASLLRMDVESSNDAPETSFLQKLRMLALQNWPAMLPSIKEAFLLLSRANLMLFYFRGVYYDVAKRVTGVRYALLTKPPLQRSRYHLLGFFLFIQLCVTGGSWFHQNIISTLRNSIKSHSTVTFMPPGHQGARVLGEDLKPISEGYWIQKSTDKHNTSEPSLGSKCTLCLGPLKWPTATPCGHVFCWDCVAECCNQKPECPLCRATMTHSELVPIYNADF